MEYLQGVQGRYEIPTMGIRQVQDPYKGYKAGMRHLQGVQGRYKTPTRVTWQV